ALQSKEKVFTHKTKVILDRDPNTKNRCDVLEQH
ncbi:hypothetical protein MPER_04617, partial [Moniliophthora perniciosa FA553]